jgi:hypothetical protein
MHAPCQRRPSRRCPQHGRLGHLSSVRSANDVFPAGKIAHDEAFGRSYPFVGLMDQCVAAPTATSSSLTCYQDTGNGVICVKVSPGGKLSDQTKSSARSRRPTRLRGPLCATAPRTTWPAAR